jgi:peptide/nickel transport system substrate-binding protein
VITAIAGTAGVGKAALARRWAHQTRERFPDGRRRTGSALAAALAVLLTLTAYDAAPAEATTTGKVTLRVALTSGSIKTLNPFTADTLVDTQIGRFMYEFLTTYTASDQTPTPALAERWWHGSDSLTWTFKLRQGMTWSDGTPLTAKDVAFTYNLMMTNPAAAHANGSYTAHFRSVHVVDDHTVMIKTKQPYAGMEGLDIPIVPEHVWSTIKDIGQFTNTETATPVVGSGPFVLTGYQPGQFVRLQANDRYWRGRPQVDEVQIVRFTDTDAAVQALRGGEVDVISGLTVDQFKALSDEPNIRVNDGRDRRYSSLLINPGAATRTGQKIGNGNPALTDVEVRQAIARALNLPMLVDRVWQGFGQVGASIIPPVFPKYHWEPSDAERRTYDPSAAGRLLDNAGWARGPGGVRVDTSGRKLELRLQVSSADPNGEQKSQFIAQWLGEIGIGVTTHYEAPGQLSDNFDKGDYDLMFTTRAVTPDPDQVLALSTCSWRQSAAGEPSPSSNYFCNADYDRMYAQQAGQLSPAKRAEIVKRMQALLYDQAPEVVLSYSHNLEAYRSDRFAPFQTQPSTNGVITGQNGYWWLYRARPVNNTNRGPSSSRGPLIIGLSVGTLLVAGLAGFGVVRRRTATADRRE